MLGVRGIYLVEKRQCHTIDRLPNSTYLYQRMKKESIQEPAVPYDRHYTYRDYLQFAYDEVVEIIHGKIFRMTPGPSPSHQWISGNLFGPIYNFFSEKDCKFFSAPFDVILPVTGKDFMDSDRVVQPDICVICDLEKIQERGCFGAPDWVIEIISPHTTKRDLQDKFDLYEDSGVKEYWIVEPRNHTVEVFSLENDEYRRIRTYVREDEVSPVLFPDLVIGLEDVFRE